MPKAYWIAQVTVTEPDHYPEYIKAGAPVYEKYGARFIVRGGQSEALEGNTRSRCVVVEFKDMETAKAAYDSPEYQIAKALRNKYAESDVMIVEGVE